MKTPKNAVRTVRRLSPCALVALLAMAASTHVRANNTPAASAQPAEVRFNEDFLRLGNGMPLDLSRYNKGNPAEAGSYRADLYVNQIWLGRTTVTLKALATRRGDVATCFDRDLLARVGVDLQRLPPEAVALLAGEKASPRDCTTLSQLVPDATAFFDNGEQRLDISVPQAALRRQARGYVDPSQWDDGVPAATLQYDANYYRSKSADKSDSQGYLGLVAGGNIGPWRLRHHGSLTAGAMRGTHYQGTLTYVQRTIEPLGSQLVVGDAFTEGALFDSFGFRGVQLATDDRMVPESQRGYAPRITGIARSNAVVRVRQNGNLLRETTVAAGAFVIDDLYPTGYGGNLDVEITEADGSVQVSKVPYAAAVNALRPGITRYRVTAGQLRDSQLHSRPALFQGTVQHGFTNAITGYGGLLVARGYRALVAGAALNTEWGAFGVDLTRTAASLAGQERRSGHSMRLAYTKTLAPTDTHVTLAAYRYSSKGYLGLREAVALRESSEPLRGDGIGLPGGHLRGRLQLMLNQNLPRDMGSLYLSGSMQDYWNREGRDTQFQAGYSKSFGRVNVGLAASRQFDALRKRWNNTVMLTVGIPLDTGSRQVYTTSSVQRDSSGVVDVRTSASGVLGEDNTWSYSLNASHSQGGEGAQKSSRTGGGATVAHTSPFATWRGSASVGEGYSQLGMGVSGGVVAYGGGVVFTPAMGETLAIVEASGATGARVANASGLRIGPRGQAVVSNLMPFASNEVELDPKGLPMSVELKSSTQRVAPTAGAVVKLKFETSGGGRSVLVRVTLPDGTPVPFGARVTNAEGQEIGTVAQDGRLLLRSVTVDAARYDLAWGERGDQRCRLPLELGKATPDLADGAQPAWQTVNARCTAW